MDTCILFNPACGTCRNTDALLREKGIELPKREYLKDAPDEKDLAEICALLGMRPSQIVRRKEALFTELKLDTLAPDDDARWLKVLAQNPRLIERPIVIYNGKAVIARPAENVLSLL